MGLVFVSILCLLVGAFNLFMFKVIIDMYVFIAILLIVLDFFLIYFWLCWVFVAVCGFSLVVVSGGYSSLLCVGFSLSWLLLLQSMGSKHAGVRSCGTWAQ